MPGRLRWGKADTRVSPFGVRGSTFVCSAAQHRRTQGLLQVHARRLRRLQVVGLQEGRLRRGAQVPPVRRQVRRWGPPGVHTHPPLGRHHWRPALRLHDSGKLLSMLRYVPQVQVPIPLSNSHTGA